MPNSIFTLERITNTGKIDVAHCYRWRPTAEKALKQMIESGETGYRIVEYQEQGGRYQQVDE